MYPQLVAASPDPDACNRQVHHKYSQCKLSAVERMGVEAYRRLNALLSRAFPLPDDLSVSEVAENQCEASKMALIQVEQEGERVGETDRQGGDGRRGGGGREGYAGGGRGD